MSPEALIEQATTEGVRLALSESGAIKATGDALAVDRWLPRIRERKPAIIKALLARSASTGDIAAVRAWLAFIGEHDPEIINDVITKCQTDSEALAYFTSRAANKKTEGNDHAD